MGFSIKKSKRNKINIRYNDRFSGLRLPWIDLRLTPAPKTLEGKKVRLSWSEERTPGACSTWSILAEPGLGKVAEIVA